MLLRAPTHRSKKPSSPSIVSVCPARFGVHSICARYSHAPGITSPVGSLLARQLSENRHEPLRHAERDRLLPAPDIDPVALDQLVPRLQLVAA